MKQHPQNFFFFLTNLMSIFMNFSNKKKISTIVGGKRNFCSFFARTPWVEKPNRISTFIFLNKICGKYFCRNFCTSDVPESSDLV